MGACSEKPKFAIVTEFMHNGSLYDILHDENMRIPLTWSNKISFAFDAAKGMAFLHGNNPAFLHRDLKSLNLLVDEKWNVKVSDFGMTTFKEENKGDMGSIFWTAPEVFDNPKNFTKGISP